MSSFTQRMLGTAKLSIPIIEEIEADRGATPQALAVVALVAVTSGIGGLYFGGFHFVIMGILTSIIGWAVWAALIWLIGTKLMPEPQTRSDWGEIARTTGFAQSPGVLRLFGFIPVVGWIVSLIANVWMLVAMIVAIRQALDYRDTWRAVVVVLIGWLVNLLLYYLMGVSS